MATTKKATKKPSTPKPVGRPKVEWSRVVGYQIEFEIGERSLITDDEGEYIKDIYGKVFFRDEEAGIERDEAATVTAHLIQADRACNNGVSLWNECDAHSAELELVHTLAYDTNDRGRLKESVTDGCGGADLLYVASITVVPKHRGRRLGQLALQRTIDCFASAAVILQPFPLQLRSPERMRYVNSDGTSETDQEIDERLRLADFDQDPTRATARLTRYWSEVGFSPLDGMPRVRSSAAPDVIAEPGWLVRDMGCVGPTIRTFIGD